MISRARPDVHGILQTHPPQTSALPSTMLGQKRAILLAHHGQPVARLTIEEAAVLAVFMVRAAKMQLRARAIGPIKPIRPELAREARQSRLKPKAIEATFNYFARQIRRDQGDEVLT